MKDCRNAELANEIVVLDWGLKEIRKQDVKLYKYDSLFTKKIDSLNVQEVFVFTDKNTGSHYGTMKIILDESLFSRENYRLILLDSMKYEVSEIKISTKTVMIGMREDNMCTILNYKVNDSLNKLGSGGNQIILKKNLYKLLQKM